jgi:uncharacterized protein (DUF433 family)
LYADVRIVLRKAISLNDLFQIKFMKFDRITASPEMMNGQPCIRGMRLTVWRLIEITKTYPDRTELFQAFPEIEEEDIQQALAFATHCKINLIEDDMML